MAIKPFNPEADDVKTYLASFTKNLAGNFYFDQLLAGDLVPKTEKSTVSGDVSISGGLQISRSLRIPSGTDPDTLMNMGIYFYYPVTGAINGAIYQDAQRLKIENRNAYGVGDIQIGTSDAINPVNLIGSRIIIRASSNPTSDDIVIDGNGVIAFSDAADPGAVKANKLYNSAGGFLKWNDSIIERQINKNAAGGYVGLTGSKITGSLQTYGTAANTACEGNDSRLAHNYGELYAHENATATTIIGTAGDLHPLEGIGIAEGYGYGVTFTAGTTGSIASAANYGGTVPGAVLFTDVAHGLTSGDVISIHSSTNYDGVHYITKVSDDTFYVHVTWVADRTGTWRRADRLVATTAGIYKVNLSLTAHATTANKIMRFDVCVGASANAHLAVSHKFATTDYAPLSVSGHVSLSVGTPVWVAVRNQTDAVDITVRHLNLSMRLL